MTNNYFYFDQTDQRQGPVSEQQLKELAARGIIGTHTPMETDTGHKGVAGQIPGLFPAASQTQTVSGPLPPPKQLFCTHCGQPIAEQAAACMSCGAKPVGHRKFCRQCGVALNPEQVICVKCGGAITGSFDMGGFFAAVKEVLSKCLNQAAGILNRGGFSAAAEANTNQGKSLMPVILPGLMVLLFFTPQLVAFTPKSTWSMQPSEE